MVKGNTRMEASGKNEVAMSEIQSTPPDGFYNPICDILEAARTGVVRTVNTAQVLSNWLIGREIVEAEQQGQHRADYGENLLKNLAQKLKQRICVEIQPFYDSQVREVMGKVT